MTEAMGVPVSQHWESVRKCGTAVRACLQRQAVCKCFARTYHGCGLQSLVSEKERERRVCFTSHPCEHIRTNTTVNMSELVSVCACVLAWASSLADWLIARLQTDSLSPAFLLSSFFRTPDFSVLTEWEVYNNTWERHIKGGKRERRWWAWGRGGHLSPLSLI